MRFIKRVLIFVFILAVGFLLGEFIARHTFQKKLQELTFSESDLYYYYDPAGIRRHIPNKIGYERLWNDKGNAEFRINSLGFRGNEIKTEKSPDVFRILFLGDSITLGGRLPEEEIFVRKVERSLEKIEPGRYEAVNAGVGDVGLSEEELLLNGAGLKIKPDLVILCWYLNDNRPSVGFPEEIVYKNSVIRWFNRQNWLRKSHFVGLLYNSFRTTLVKHQINITDSFSRRFQWVDTYNEMKFINDPAEFTSLVSLAEYDWGDAWKEDSLQSSFEKIARMGQTARQRGTDFCVVALPEHAQVYAQFHSPFISYPQNRLRDLCETARIPFLDLLPPLRKQRSLRLFYDNCHYTPEGNTVVSKIILDWLLENHLL